MKILYKNKKTKTLCENLNIAKKEYGNVVAEKLISTIQFIKRAATLMDVRAMPQFKLHPLKGNFKNLYSIYLGQKTGFRLIIKPLDTNEKPIINDEKSNIYKRTLCVEIKEVSSHYE